MPTPLSECTDQELIEVRGFPFAGKRGRFKGIWCEDGRMQVFGRYFSAPISEVPERFKVLAPGKGNVFIPARSDRQPYVDDEIDMKCGLASCAKWVYDPAEHGKLIVHDSTLSENMAVVCQLSMEVGIEGHEDVSELSALIIDSGATHHVMSSSSMFEEGTYQTVKRINPSTNTPYCVRTGGGERHPVVGMGSVVLHSQWESVPVVLRLKTVLHVPSMKYNIFSVKEAALRGAVTQFFGDSVEVKMMNTTVLRGKVRNGMYVAPTVKSDWYVEVLPVDCDLSRILLTESCANVCVVSFERWHQRLGHPAYSVLNAMIQHDTAHGLHCSSEIPTHKCDVCQLAKQHRASFSTSHTETFRVLEMVHADTMGPVRPSSLGGSKFVLVVLDDFSRFSAVRFLESKAEIPGALIDLLELWQRQTTQELLVLRTDNGTEFCNSALKSYLTSNGIKHQLSVRYTPEQNGRVERVNRTLGDRTRALMLESGVPKKLWAEAMSTANFLRNVVPALKMSASPYELFTGKKPDLSMLRIFGCTAYAHIPRQLRGKLDSCSEIGMLVGYSATSKAWRIAFKRDNGHLVIAERVHVVFDESKFVALDEVSKLSKSDLVDLGLHVDSMGENSTRRQHNIGQNDQAGNDDEENADHIEHEEERFENEDAADEGAEDEPAAVQNMQQIPNEHADVIDEAPVAEQPALRRSSRVSAKPWRPYDGEITVTQGLTDTPLTVTECKSRPDWPQWQAAINTELQALTATHTYEVVKLPEGRKALPTRWVFKLKRDSVGRVQVHRARLAVKGFHQKPGIDYEEVFAPVSRHATFRTMVSIVCQEDMEMHQMDVRTAFLNAQLDEEVYVKIPEGAGDTANYVWKLNKAMNGLKQAPRAWYKTLRKSLNSLGYFQTNADPSLYIKQTPKVYSMILVYVDDLLIAGRFPEVESVKNEIAKIFEVKDEGEATFFLGISIKRDRTNRRVWLGQTKYALEIIDRFGLSECKPRRIPLDANLQLSKNKGEPNLELLTTYQEMVGALLYLSNCTRPDIAHAVGMLARFMSNPCEDHAKAAKQVLRYVAGSTKMGIEFKPSKKGITGYSDADYAGDPDKRKSTSGNVFILNQGAISWSSKLQGTVAASTCEAEFIAAAMATKEALWLKMLLHEISGGCEAIDLYVDNQGALKLIHHPHAHQRTKHIDVAYRFVQEYVERGEIHCQYVGTTDMVADCLTKSLSVTQFLKNITSMGLKESP